MNQKEVFKRITISEIVAIVSSLGVIGWIITDFFGGMILYLFTYAVLIVPVLIVYLFSIIDTIYSLLKGGFRKARLKTVAHVCVIMFILFLNLYNSDTFKSKAIHTCTLKDDLCYFRLILRENGKFENTVMGIFGFSQNFRGSYLKEGNMIIFKDRPYDNDFLPDTMLLDIEQKALFFNKKEDGTFSEEKTWLNFFEIHE